MEYSISFKPGLCLREDEVAALVAEAVGKPLAPFRRASPRMPLSIVSQGAGFLLRAETPDGYCDYRLPGSALRPLLECLAGRGVAPVLYAPPPRWDGLCVRDLSAVLQSFPAGATLTVDGARFDVDAAPLLLECMRTARIAGLRLDDIDRHGPFSHYPSDRNYGEATAFAVALIEGLPTVPTIREVSVSYIDVNDRVWSSLAMALHRVPGLRRFRLREAEIEPGKAMTLLHNLAATGLTDLRYDGPLTAPGTDRCVRLPPGLTHLSFRPYNAIETAFDALPPGLFGRIRVLPLRRLRLESLGYADLAELAAIVRDSQITYLTVGICGPRDVSDEFVAAITADLARSPVQRFRGGSKECSDVVNTLICAGVDAWFGDHGWEREAGQASLREAYRLYTAGAGVLPPNLLLPVIEAVHGHPRATLDRIAVY